MVINRGMRKSFFDVIASSSSRKRAIAADVPDEVRELDAVFWDTLDDYLYPER